MNIMNANEPLASGIAILIKESGLKQIAVANRAGYSGQEFSDMLNGRRLIKACDIPRIATALNKKPNDLYDAGKRLEPEKEVV